MSLTHLPLILRQTTVHSFAWQGVLVQNLSKFNCVGNRLDEDDNLVEVETVDEVHQLLDLFVALELNVVLLESVEGQS